MVTDVSQTLDIPSEWYETVIYNLAERLTESYTVPPQKQQVIFGKAQLLLENSLGWDEEVQSISIQPEFN